MDIAILRTRFIADTSDLDRGYADAKKQQRDFAREGKKYGTVNLALNYGEFSKGLKKAEGIAKTSGARMEKYLTFAPKLNTGNFNRSLRSVEANVTKAVANIQRKISSISGGDDIDFTVTARGTEQAAAQLERVDEHADEVDGRTVKVDVDRGGIANIQAATGSFSEMAQSIRNIGAVVGAAKIPFLIAGLGAVIPVVGSLTASLAGLALGLTRASAGMGAAGAVAGGAGVAGLMAYVSGIKAVTSASREAYLATHEQTEAQLEKYKQDTLNTQASIRFNEEINQTSVQLYRLQAAVGSAVFPSFTRELDYWGEYMVEFTPAIAQTAGVIAQLAAGFSEWIRTAQEGHMLRQMFAFINDQAIALTMVLANLGQIGFRIFQAIIPSARLLSNEVVGLTGDLNKFVMGAARSGELRAFFSGLYAEGRRLVPTFRDLAIGLYNVFQAVQGSGLVTQAMGGLRQLASGFRQITTEGTKTRAALDGFLKDAQPIIDRVATATLQWASAIGRVAQEVITFRVAGQEMTVLEQIIDSLGKAAGPIGDLLVDTFKMLGPEIPPLIDNVAQLANTFAGATHPLVGLVSSFNTLAARFNSLSPTTKTFIADMTAAYAIFKLFGAGGLVGSLTSGITRAVGAWGTYKAATNAAAAATSAQSAAQSVANTKMKATAPALTAATGAQARFATASKTTGTATAATAATAASTGSKWGGLGAVFSKVGGVLMTLGRFLLGPWGLAIAAVVAAGIAIYKNWDTISAAIEPVIQVFQDFWAQLQPMLRVLGSALSEAFSALAQGFMSVVAPGKSMDGIFKGLVPTLTNLGQQVIPVIARAILSFTNFLKQNQPTIVAVGKVIGTILVGAFKVLGAVVKSAWVIVTAGVRAIIFVIKTLIALPGNIGRSWQAFKTVIVAVWNAVKQAVVSGAQAVWNAVQSAWNRVKAVTSAVWRSIVSTVLGFLRSVAQGVVRGAQAVWRAMQGAWNKVKQVTQQVWRTIVSSIVGFMRGVAQAVIRGAQGVWRGIQQAWNKVRQITSSVWNGIKRVLSQVWNWMKQQLTTSAKFWWSVIQKAWNKVKQVTTSVWNGIKSVLTSVWNWIKSTAQSVWNALVNLIQAAWNNIKNTAQSTWNAIKSLLQAAWNAIKAAAQAVWNAVVNLIKTAWNNIKSNVTSAINSLKTSLSTAWENIKSTATSAWEAIKGAITEPVEAAYNFVKEKWTALENFVSGILSRLGLGGGGGEANGSGGGGGGGGTAPITTNARGGINWAGGKHQQYAKGGIAKAARGGDFAKRRSSQIIEWGEGPADEAAIFITKDRRQRNANENYMRVGASLLGGEYVSGREKKRRGMGFVSGAGEGLGATHYNVTADVKAEADKIANAVGGSWNTYYGHGEPGGSVESRTFDVWGPGGRGAPIGASNGFKAADMALASGGPPVLYIIRQGEMWRGGWSPWPEDPHYDHTHISYTPNGASAGTGGLTNVPNPMQAAFDLAWKPAESMINAAAGGVEAISPHVLVQAAGGLMKQTGGKIHDAIDAKIPDTILGPGSTGPQTGSAAKGLTAGKVVDQTGWGSDAGTAVGIMGAESGFNAGAKNPSSTAYGLFQVLQSTAEGVGSVYNMLGDPLYNSETAVKVRDAQGLSAWVAWSSGAYQQYMGQENTAITGYHKGGLVGGRKGSDQPIMAQQGELVMPRAMVQKFQRGGVSVPTQTWDLVSQPGALGFSGPAAGDAISANKEIWGSTGVKFGSGTDVTATYGATAPGSDGTTYSDGRMVVLPQHAGTAGGQHIWGHEGGHALKLAHNTVGIMGAVNSQTFAAPQELSTIKALWGGGTSKGGKIGGGASGGHRRTVTGSLGGSYHAGSYANARGTPGVGGSEVWDAIEAQGRMIRAGLDAVATSIDRQTYELPERIAGGVGRRMRSDREMQRSMQQARREIEARSDMLGIAV